MADVHILPDVSMMSPSDLSAWLRHGAPESPSVVMVNQVARRLQTEEIPGLRPISLAFLRTSTLEPLSPYLAYQSARAGFQASFWFSGYSDWRVQAGTPDSLFYARDPDAILLFLRLEELSSGLSEGFAVLSPDDIAQEKEKILTEIEGTLQAIRRHSTAQVLIHNFPLIACPANGIYDSQIVPGQNETVEQINRDIRSVVGKHPGVYLFDYCLWSARFGLDSLTDRHLLWTARVPISRKALNPLALEYVRYLTPLLTVRRKCLVVDLDGTLWGGILGEDGFAGIKLGNTYPGNAFREVQQTILDLYHRGVILAICSKNNEPEALRVLQEHPDMLLRPEHFATMRINWDDKVANLRAISAELSIGLDSLVFLDDNPAERALVRQLLPEVLVVEIPNGMTQSVSALRRIVEFEALSLTPEDRQRGAMYGEQIARQRLQQASESLEDYYASLDMRLDIGLADAYSIPRISQLTQKTNQFNLTTRRYSENDIDRLVSDESWRVYWLRMIDRFGDNGIAAVGILHELDDAISEIDTFLLSCRIVGRTVEDAFLAFLIRQAKSGGAKRVRGWLYPTDRNTPAQGFYKKLGFALIGKNAEDTLWEWCIDGRDLRIPAWFKLTEVPAFDHL